MPFDTVLLECTAALAVAVEHIASFGMGTCLEALPYIAVLVVDNNTAAEVGMPHKREAWEHLGLAGAELNASHMVYCNSSYVEFTLFLPYISFIR